MEVDAEYRPLVSRRSGVAVSHGYGRPLSPACRWNRTPHLAFLHWDRNVKEERMGRGILLWLLGVPIPIIILLWLFFGR